MTYKEAIVRLSGDVYELYGNMIAHHPDLAKSELTQSEEALAVLRRAEPLLEAVEKADPEHIAMDENWTALAFTPCQDVRAILREALAYRSAKEKP